MQNNNVLLIALTQVQSKIHSILAIKSTHWNSIKVRHMENIAINLAEKLKTEKIIIPEYINDHWEKWFYVQHNDDVQNR